ncbi:MAG: class I SAM-dependent methyltransferase [Anaerolineae bacterium]
MEYVTCNLCGSDETRLLYPSTLPEDSTEEDNQRFRCTSSRYGIHPPIVQCQVCGLVYTNPRWKAASILKGYQEVVDETYLKEREGRVLTFRRNLQPLENIVPSITGQRLLDVGCHIGVFLEIAQERGWEAWGVEPSHWAAEQAQAKGLQVINGTLEEAAFPDASFDVVTMWDVIEHLTDPLGELREVNRVLKEGGLLCVHTMDIESPLARVLGERWPWLMEMHLYYFSRRTLTSMLEKAGFGVIRTVIQGRFLRLGYLVSRLEAYSAGLSHVLGKLMEDLGLSGMPVPINLGDLFTTFARKVGEESRP